MQNAGQSPVGGSRTSGVDPGNGKMRRTPDLERDYLHHLRSHVASLKGPECPAGLFLVSTPWNLCSESEALLSGSKQKKSSLATNLPANLPSEIAGLR